MSMPKKNKKSAPAPNQMTIFDLLKTASSASPVPVGGVSFHAEFCAAISHDMGAAYPDSGRAGVTRYDVAARMSNLLNYEITKTKLDEWAAPSKDSRLPDPIELAAFVRATGGRKAMDVMARHAGLFTLPGPEALRAEIQRLYEDGKRIKEEMKKRRLLLTEVERAR